MAPADKKNGGTIERVKMKNMLCGVFRTPHHKKQSSAPHSHERREEERESRHVGCWSERHLIGAPPKELNCIVSVV